MKKMIEVIVAVTEVLVNGKPVAMELNKVKLYSVGVFPIPR
ncbi:hypothetical protein [Bacillus sp. FDAARGOS_1420]|nr:hypothetical protein [Bacillus sp. FDAARGOS_1420]